MIQALGKRLYADIEKVSLASFYSQVSVFNKEDVSVGHFCYVKSEVPNTPIKIMQRIGSLRDLYLQHVQTCGDCPNKIFIGALKAEKEILWEYLENPPAEYIERYQRFIVRAPKVKVE